MSRCRICKAEFRKLRPLQAVCSIDCAKEHSRKTSAKQALMEARKTRKEIRERKEKLKTRSDYYKDAAKAVRDFARARDEGKECISCDTILIKRGAPGGDYDAGHYRGTGRAKHLELVEMNQNGQCKHCNRDHHGSYLEQRPKMIARYGLAAVEALEADQAPRKYTIDELKEITAMYRKKLRELKCA